MARLKLISRKTNGNLHEIIVEGTDLTQDQVQDFFSNYGEGELVKNDDGNYVFRVGEGTDLNALVSDSFTGKIQGYPVIRALKDPERFSDEVEGFDPAVHGKTSQNLTKKLNYRQKKASEGGMFKNAENALKKGLIGLTAAAAISGAGYLGYNAVTDKLEENKAEKLKIEQVEAEKVAYENLLVKESELYENASSLLASEEVSQASSVLKEAENLREGIQFGDLREEINIAVTEKEAEKAELERIAELKDKYSNINLENNTIEYSSRFGESLWNVAEQVWSTRHNGATPDMAKGSDELKEVYTIWDGICKNVRNNVENLDDLEVGQPINIPANLEEVSVAQVEEVSLTLKEVETITSIERAAMNHEYEFALEKLETLDGAYSDLEDRIQSQKVQYEANVAQVNKTEEIASNLKDVNTYLAVSDFDAAMNSIESAEELSGLTFDLFRNKVAEAKVQYGVEESRDKVIESLDHASHYEGDLNVASEGLENLGPEYSELIKKLDVVVKRANEVQEWADFDLTREQLENGNVEEALETIGAVRKLNQDTFLMSGNDDEQATEYAAFESTVSDAMAEQFGNEAKQLIEAGNYQEALNKLEEGKEFGEYAMLFQKANFGIVNDLVEEADTLYSAGNFEGALEKLKESTNFSSTVSQQALASEIFESYRENFDAEVNGLIETRDFEGASEVLANYESKFGTQDSLKLKLVDSKRESFRSDAAELIETRDFEGALDTILSGEEVFGNVYSDVKNVAVDSLIADYRSNVKGLIADGNLESALETILVSEKRTGPAYEDLKIKVSNEYAGIEEGYFNDSSKLFAGAKYVESLEELAKAEAVSEGDQYSGIKETVQDKLNTLNRYATTEDGNLEVVSNEGEGIWDLAKTYMETKDNKKLKLEYEGHFTNKPQDLKDLVNYVVEILELNDMETANPYHTLEEGTVLRMPQYK